MPEPKTKYWYKDFETDKLHYTCGQFCGFTKGFIAPTAIFRTPATVIFVPTYCLMPETRQLLEALEQEKTNEIDPSFHS